MPEAFEFAGLDTLIRTALNEDIGTGDITTLSCIQENAVSKGHFIAKAEGVIAGLPIAARVFELLDPRIKLTMLVRDGNHVDKGDIVASIEGPARSVLTGERTALNLLQHLSGIATRTREAADAIAGTKAQIVDTRKTTPGHRVLEKYAVRCGGGKNHRFNLSDGILIKDNHIVAAGGISQAIERVRSLAPHTLRIEIETENLEMIDEALSAGADIIMLDNMTLDDMSQAVRHIAGRALTEASGNMGDKDAHELRKVAETGVNYISIGALTNHIKALDISLRFV